MFVLENYGHKKLYWAALLPTRKGYTFLFVFAYYIWRNLSFEGVFFVREERGWGLQQYTIHIHNSISLKIMPDFPNDR